MNMLRNCSIERIRKGEFVVREGDQGDKFYIILQGHLQVLKTNEQKT